MKTLTGIQAIQSLDLGDVKRDLMDARRGPGFDEARADEAIDGYKAFLERHLLTPDNDDNPTLDVDQAWHFHILRTRAYISDCQAVFGSYFHHFPDKPVPAHLQAEEHSLCGNGGGGKGGCKGRVESNYALCGNGGGGKGGCKGRVESKELVGSSSTRSALAAMSTNKLSLDQGMALSEMSKF